MDPLKTVHLLEADIYALVVSMSLSVYQVSLCNDLWHTETQLKVSTSRIL